MSGGIERLCWGWNRPVLEQAVDLLTRHWLPKQGTLDLSEVLVVVPTTEAGRRLKEALARKADAFEHAATVPWVWSPEQVLLPPQERATTASSLQIELAWHHALETQRLEDLPALFPVLPESRSWLWHQETARLLAELKTLLGAGGLTMAETAGRVMHDGARWQDLVKLEQAYLAELEKVGLRDPHAAKTGVAESPVLPPDIRRIVILPAPDLPPLMARWVHSCLTRQVTVTVAIHAPPSLAASFDEAGRPVPERWGENADLVLPLAEPAIHIRRDASAQAAKVIDLLRELASQDRSAMGVCDPEVAAVLSEKLDVEGVRVFEPGGVSVQEVGLWHVLTSFKALLAGGSWKSFASLLRVPEVRKMWLGEGQSGLQLLEEADTFAAEHLPVTLLHAQQLLDAQNDPHYSVLPAAMGAARQLLREMQSQTLAEAARTLILRLYGERTFQPDAPIDQLTVELASEWLVTIAGIVAETDRFGLAPGADETLALSLDLLSKNKLSQPRGEVDLVLQGWLELLWESAPNLVVAGMNEEHIPGIFISHPFLPDRVREGLGLPCQASRFARDAYILAALAGQRQGPGALHVLCGQWSERGDALRPSRLLFLCQDADLPTRVEHLFPKEDHAAEAPEPARSIAWKLRPRAKAIKLERISASRIRSYLECPFRDYLSSELRMEGVNPSQRELGALEFGNLVHHSFQALANDAKARASTDAKEIADFLIEQAKAEAQLLYGLRPAPLVTLQMESLKQRLKYAAETEAAQRADGWRIVRAEWPIGGPEDAHPLIIEGARLCGKIDRVERHETTGEIRLLDFKTSDKACEPEEAHVLNVQRRKLAEQDLWKCFAAPDGTPCAWRDLQLPLYAAAMRLHGQTPHQVGYFCLPKNVQETEVLTWETFDDAWIDRAVQCAGEVVRRIRAGIFWPPSAKAYEREFDYLFLGDLEAAVDADGLQGRS